MLLLIGFHVEQCLMEGKSKPDSREVVNRCWYGGHEVAELVFWLCGIKATRACQSSSHGRLSSCFIKKVFKP